jgi:hypothetical protein
LSEDINKDGQDKQDIIGVLRFRLTPSLVEKQGKGFYFDYYLTSAYVADG